MNILHTDIRRIEYRSPLYHQATQLRYQLFYQEHKIPFDAIFDETEPQDTHVAIVNCANDHVIAYGRLAQNHAEESQIYQMVVDPAYQKQGFGTQLLEALTEIAQNRGSQRIVLQARVAKTGFYEKLGFTAIGDVFASPTTGIPHVKMEKRLGITV
jgi:predicted GNAT family N-acyltransferase